MTSTRMRPVAPARASAPKTGKRLDIQGLRAVAVLAVVADHLFEWPSGGFIGVDVFFVISGFLITGLLLREYERTGHISFVEFYRRRVKRIVPAATLVLAITVAASLVLLSIERTKEIAYDALSGFFFFANWRFAASGTDYFQEGLPPSPLQHYWSLSVEEQFYFVWPWVMLGLMLLGTRLFGLGRQHVRVVAGTAIVLVTAASFGWAMWETQDNPTVAYFSSLSRAWELGIGALLAVVATKVRIGSVALRTVLGYVGLLGIAVSLFVVPDSPGFPAPWAALPVLATALVILAGIGGPQPYLYPLTNRVAGYIGDISYSLYLWHFPVIILLAALVETGTMTYYAIALVLMFAASIASFHLIENPARQHEWTIRSRRGRSPAVGWQYVGGLAIAIPTIALCIAVLMPGRYDAPATSPFARSPIGQTIGNDSDETSCVGAQVLAQGSDCALNTGDEVYPAPEDAAQDNWEAYNCWIDGEPEPADCSYGSDDPKAVKAALVGDSHAASLLPGLIEPVTELEWSLDVFTGNGCQWVIPSLTDFCPAMPVIQDRLASAQPKYDVIIVTASRTKAGWSDTSGVVSAYREAWKPVLAKGTRIVVVADTPVVSEDALACTTRIGFNVGDCSMPKSEAMAVVDPVPLAAQGVRGVAVVDPTRYYCPDDKCPMTIGNVMVYKDAAGHLTATYSQSLGPILMAEIAKAVPLKG
ncbi:acyltransferase family protein [Nocardioides ochotonae]|uniref:acyltransferase family protein n=1 Tax=Nocardioides ochotonae TaxID=2685869 RepID=UPI00140DE11A|nr:acyltransferase family protein [Nocardioides ochotonae]